MTSANPLVDDLDHILAHTSAVWDALRGQNLFITGGTGFFGRWLLESFSHGNRELQLGAQLVVLSRNPDAFRSKAPHLAADASIRFVTGDVRSFTAASVSDQLGSDSPTRYGFVIHAATEASAKLNSEDPLLMMDTIVAGTRTALQFAVETGAKRFLLTSSGAVYGHQPSEITHIQEDYVGAPDCTDPNSAYGEAKRLAELLCACFHKQHGIDPLIVRCFAFLGPFLPLDAHFAIGNFIRDALNGGPIHVNGDGTPYRSYLYASDLAVWLWTILFGGESCRPYNVGSGHDFTVAQIADAVRSAIDPHLDIEIANRAGPDAVASRYVPAITRAKQEQHLEERISLSDAIKRTARFIRSPYSTPAR
jgi:nucleoside-diphosphate-sugar epimerase